MVLEKRANASRPGMLQFSLGDIRTLTDAPSRKTMLSEKSETDRTSTANMNSRQKKADWPQPAAELASGNRCISRPWCRPCRMDLTVTQVRRRRFRMILRSRRSSEPFPIFVVNQSRHGTHDEHSALSAPHSKPGAFIAQIAAMNRAFARGRMVIVSANAVSGHTVMLTKSGH